MDFKENDPQVATLIKSLTDTVASLTADMEKMAAKEKELNSTIVELKAEMEKIKAEKDLSNLSISETNIPSKVVSSVKNAIYRYEHLRSWSWEDILTGKNRMICCYTTLLNMNGRRCTCGYLIAVRMLVLLF